MLQILAETFSQMRQRRTLWISGLIAAIIIGLITFWISPTSFTGLISKYNDPRLSLPVVMGVTQPLPQAVELNSRQIALGQRLFHDPRLSADNTISCASCHNIGGGGSDNLQQSIGIKGRVGNINAPTVLNSGFNFTQFWDGRANTLEAQIDSPVQHPKEMGSTWAELLQKIASDSEYKKEFSAIYPQQGITVETVKSAIATFERSLITPNSRFDQFLQGKSSALNAQEQNGWMLFQSYGCVACHQGINLGGNMYEKMGLMGDYFADRKNITEGDNGRFNLTKNPEHMHEFRVPSLRNVDKTAPYFHDGSAKTLEQAILVMAKYQLGRHMPDKAVEDIAAFLRTLTGELVIGKKP